MGERFSPIQRSTLLLCFFAYAAAYTGRLNLSAAIPGLRGGIAMSDAQAGLFQTVFALVYAAGQCSPLSPSAVENAWPKYKKCTWS